MKITATFTQDDLLDLLIVYLEAKFHIKVTKEDLKFEVSSKVNYKHEWEEGRFRASINKEVQ